MSLLLAGCTLPPDIALSPRPGPPPQVQRDTRLSGRPAIASALLERAQAFPEAPEVVLLETGDDALIERIHLIRAATRSIEIQTFIWVFDRTGSWVFKELLEAARRGVQVRILIDQFVPPELTAEDYAALVTAHANLEVRLFRPLTGKAINTPWDVVQNTFTRYATLNRRMHNKILLVDGAAAIIGGRNYQDAYHDRDPVLNFRDRDVVVTGPVCRQILLSFEEFWEYPKSYEASRMSDLSAALSSGRASLPASMEAAVAPDLVVLDAQASLYDPSSVQPGLRAWPVRQISFYSDSPEKVERLRAPWQDRAFKELEDAVMEASREIIIETPYPVIGNRSYRLARKLRKEKPELRIRVSTNSLSSGDHLAVGAIALKQRRQQIEGLGLELHVAKPVPADIETLVPRYRQLLQETANPDDPNWSADPQLPPIDIKGPRFCVHGKSVVFDRKACFVGSHNFDPRSFNLNTECGVLIRDEAFSSHLAGIIELAMHPRNSWVVARRDFPPVMAELNSLLSFISSNLPMFDLWPLEHVTCFELKEDGTPLRPDDPCFYQNYRDVGPLPGMSIGLREVQVHLIRGFGGMTAPLM